jgi:hypothetical protein
MAAAPRCTPIWLCPGAARALVYGDGHEQLSGNPIMMANVRSCVLGAAIILTAGSAWPAQADEAAEATYVRYHQAIRAAVHCLRNDVEFDQPEQHRMGAVIDQDVGFGVGAGRRLTLIEQAKSEMRDMVQKWGCKSDKLAPHLALFHEKLEPAL